MVNVDILYKDGQGVIFYSRENKIALVKDRVVMDRDLEEILNAMKNQLRA